MVPQSLVDEPSVFSRRPLVLQKALPCPTPPSPTSCPSCFCWKRAPRWATAWSLGRAWKPGWTWSCSTWGRPGPLPSKGVSTAPTLRPNSRVSRSHLCLIWIPKCGPAHGGGGGLAGFQERTEVTEIFLTDFQMRLLWGSRGAEENQALRYAKFDQVLTALSNKLEPPVRAR